MWRSRSTSTACDGRIRLRRGERGGGCSERELEKSMRERRVRERENWRGKENKEESSEVWSYKYRELRKG